MKKTNILIILIVLIILGAAAYFVFFNNSGETAHSNGYTGDDILECRNISEVKRIAEEKNFACVENDSVLNLYHAPILDKQWYVMISYTESDGNITKIEAYLEMEESEDISSELNKIKNSINSVMHIGEDTAFEYIPVADEYGETKNNVGEADFMQGGATKELMFEDYKNIWNVIGFISGEEQSIRLIRISK